ncbi:hypothetical protein GCM10025789_09030 [Tessaracoccus lubricantis]|uniref:Nuclear transport factor 2 family protein n=1 Tax=Tessaracoccus lubricantis TaxID=545543 RepID=A0ABP9FBI4_9ACTN
MLPTEDPESAAIVAGWQEYQRVYEKFAMAPNEYSDFTETQYVTTGHESVVILDRIAGFRENGLELVGGVAFHDLAVGPPTDEPDGTSTATIEYCLDLNQLQVRDVATGDLVARSGRFEEVAYMRQGLDDVWRVEGITSSDEEC